MNIWPIEPRKIRFDGKTVIVKMMDDSWIINECITHGPIQPRAGIVWKHSDHCSRLLIPGDEYESTMKEFMDAYGNCAVIAWDGDVALGHMIFVPKAEAQRRQMLYHERMLETDYDAKTLVIEAVGFCSIMGHEYRGRGIGRAMGGMILEWAKLNNWKAVQVYGTPTGLFPWAWLDSCMPPYQFWQKLGFQIVAKMKTASSWQQVRDAMLADDPRASESERKLKDDIVAKVEQGKILEQQWAYEYDLERKLSGSINI